MNSQYEWLLSQYQHNQKEQDSIRKHLEGLNKRLRYLADEALILSRDLERTKKQSVKKNELEIKTYRTAMKDMSFGKGNTGN